MAHPFRVAPREVVVDGDDVDAVAAESVEDRGERRDEGLAFARSHLRDAALVEHDPADELHVEVPHLERAPAGLADKGERLRDQRLERLSRGAPLAQRPGRAREVRVGALPACPLRGR